MSLMVSPAYVTRFDERGRAYRVIPMLEDEQRSSPSALLDIPVRIPNGELVPFGSLVTLTRSTQPRALTRPAKGWLQDLRCDTSWNHQGPRLESHRGYCGTYAARRLCSRLSRRVA